MRALQRRSSRSSVRAELADFPFEEHFGVSRLSDELTNPDRYFWTLKNCYVSKRNWIEQRNGFTRYTDTVISSGYKVRKIFEVENSTGGKTVIARCHDKWIRLSGTTPTNLDTGRGSDQRGQAVQFNNKVIMCDGGAPRQSTMAWSVSNVGASGPATASACHVHNKRLILNDDSNVMQFYASKVGAIDFDTATNDAIIIDLSMVLEVGDKILGFSTFLSNFLVIWMEDHVVVYNMPTTYSEIALEQILHVGCLSYDGVIQTPDGDLWFPSKTGYKSLKESMGTKSTIDIGDVTALIGPYYRASMNAVTDKQDIIGIFYQRLNHGYFTLPFSSDPEVWAISEDLKAATGGKGNIAGHFTGITAYSFCELRNGNLLFGGSDGHIYRMDNGTNDNDTAISFEMEKTGLYFKNPKIYKSLREFEALMEASANLTAYLDYSYQTAGLSAGAITETITLTTQVSYWDVALWNVSYWDAAGQTLYKTRNLVGRGKVVSVKLRHSTKDAQLRLPYFILSLFMQGDL